MSRIWSMILKMLGIPLLGTGLAIWAMTPAPVTAQCGDNPPQKSSCITCHEQEYPVITNGEWHGIHALKDCCTSCHGGNCSTMDKDLAHQTLVANPLEDIYTNCYHCHPGDYQDRAERFGVILGITPSSRPTPTVVPVSLVVDHPIVVPSEAIPSTPAAFPWFLALGGLSFVFLFLLVLGLLYTREHRG